LRSNLQEFLARLDRAAHDQYPNQLQLLLAYIKKEPALIGLVEESCAAYPLTEVEVQERLEAHESCQLVPPHDEREYVSYCWKVLEALITQHGIAGFRDVYIFHRKGDSLGGKTDNLVRPIVNYLYDRLDKSSSVLFLLEKYKRRTEWFMRDSLRDRYRSAQASAYEKILDEDLRLFLFDQGVDYPFSAPNSPSGRADIVGSIDTNDPLVVEVKVLDKERQYGKDRVRKGFNQVVKYTNDFGKDVGYLVIFNLDDAEVSFAFDEQQNRFPPIMTLNHKRFYFIVVNLADFSAASTHAKPRVVEISKDYLLIPEEVA